MANRNLFAALLGSVLALAACDEKAPDGAPGAAAKFWMPTGEVDNTNAPTVETDARGGVHSVYPAYAGGRAYYSYCPSGCGDPSQMKVVRFATDETIANIMIALDAGGRPQVLLSGFQHVYYATPTGDFTQQASWRLDTILDHQGEREVTGEAFALDPAGKPRFIMHVYKAYLGVGQKPPAAFFVSCDADDCHDAGAWVTVKIADQMLRGSTLRYDERGVAKVAGVLTVDASDTSSGTSKAAYLECASDCDQDSSWNGIALSPTFESDTEAVSMPPAISMALTKAGQPRLLYIGSTDGRRNLTYFECDADCAGDNWSGSVISDFDKIDSGVDLALDGDDHPRFVHTIDYNIALASCDEPRCSAADAKWNLAKVEYGADMKPDDIFLYANCDVAAWFLHDPSLALLPDGRPVVGYQARDISGGGSIPADPSKPRCRAGTDMTWARMSVMAGVK